MPIIEPDKTQKKRIANLFTYIDSVLAYLPDPIVILNKDLQVTVASKTFFKTFKIIPPDIYGKPFFDIDNKKFAIPRLRKFLTRMQAKQTQFATLEVTHAFPGLGHKTLLFRARRITFEKEQTDFILLIIEDITKRKHIETQKDDFVGFVTHELKTPITSMHSFIEILQAYHTKTADKKSQFLLSKVLVQMNRLTTLLDDFTTVYKMQTDNLPLVKARVNMNDVVKEVVENFQYLSDTHEIRFIGTIKHWTLADRERLNEVLVNLITNAIKYSPMADKVIISLTETEKNIIVSVQDFGYGIPPDEQQKVFERFFRARGSKQYHVKGVGLGLYIASRIIKQHKGKLWIQSKVDHGTTFYFSLPKLLEQI